MLEDRGKEKEGYKYSQNYNQLRNIQTYKWFLRTQKKTTMRTKSIPSKISSYPTGGCQGCCSSGWSREKREKKIFIVLPQALSLRIPREKGRGTRCSQTSIYLYFSTFFSSQNYYNGVWVPSQSTVSSSSSTIQLYQTGKLISHFYRKLLAVPT